ncbi:MAG: hypothetical protein AAFY48_16085 [Bacteroidota bacterium]
MEVVLIQCNSKAGRELAEQLRQLAAELDLDFKVEDKVRSRDHFARLCLESDMVVVDVTMSEGFMELVQHVDPQIQLHHVLKVSRSFTPLNMFNVLGGGVGQYPYLEGEQEGWDNASILTYVKEHTLRIMHIDSETYEVHESNNPASDVVQNSWEYIRRLDQAYFHLFISYRSSDYQQVLKIKNKLDGSIHQETNKPIKVILFKPGELAYENELLSAMRKWQILGALEEQVAKCDELWIIDSPTYYNSWWTTGELFAVSYLNYLLEIGEGVRTQPITVRRYNVQEDTISEKIQLNPNFDENLRMRIAQHTTHTSLHEIAIGYQNKLKTDRFKNIYRKLSRVGLGWAFRKGITKLQYRSLKRALRELPADAQQEMLERYSLDGPVEINTEQFEAALNEYRWTDAFWFHPLLPVGTHNFLKVQDGGQIIELDTDAFVAFQNESVYQSYDPAELSRLINQQNGHLKVSGRTFEVERMPYRFFLHKGAATTYLIPLPIYVAREQ